MKLEGRLVTHVVKTFFFDIHILGFLNKELVVKVFRFDYYGILLLC